MAPESTSSSSPTPSGNIFDLQSLPNELLEAVFSYLDLRTFKSVRQVSQRFKSLADTKESLGNFRIKVCTRKCKQLGELLNLSETLPWSHLYLERFDTQELATASKNFVKLATLLKGRQALCGNGLKSVECPLKMGVGGGLASNYCTLRPFLLNCWDSLERIGILRLSDVRDRMLKDLEEGGIKEFERLKVLKVAFDMDIEYCGKDLLNIMEKCKDLKRLHILFADQEEHPLTIESFKTAVLSPILTFLEERRRSSQRGRDLTINFESEGSKCSIPFNFEALQKLLYYSKSSLDCQEGIHLSLENVPFLGLPTKRDLVAAQAQDPDILERLNYTVKSIKGTTQDLKLSTMEIERDSFHACCRHFMPPQSKFSLIVYLPTGNKIYLTCPSQLLPKDVQSITLVSENTRASLLLSISDEDNEWGEDKNKGFVEDLLVSRPGLQELRILTENDKKLEIPFMTQDSANFKHFDTFKNFPNLKLLHLDYWGRRHEDFWELYESLPMLEELVLHKCYRLTDESIVGTSEDGKQSMLQLKNLKHLVLDGYWSVGDASFIQVFSKMGLKTLTVWDDPDKNEKSITLTALQSLTKSVCGEHLEVLKINKPHKSTLSEIKKSLTPCRSLKNLDLMENMGAGKVVVNSIFF